MVSPRVPPKARRQIRSSETEGAKSDRNGSRVGSPSLCLSYARIVGPAPKLCRNHPAYVGMRGIDQDVLLFRDDRRWDEQQQGTLRPDPVGAVGDADATRWFCIPANVLGRTERLRRRRSE